MNDEDRDAQVDAGEVLHQARIHGAHSEREAFPEAEWLPGRPQGGVLRGPWRALQPQDAVRQPPKGKAVSLSPQKPAGAAA